ncbi:MAG: ABC transporter permease [Flavobacteriales bacterium]|nr:ABC transporter permease [Flavobacteriales bacterium]MBK9196089.1 ABC transporter permease [Flavobacteriales bacterium]MBP6573870.1 ABC transporter permease [Flavobacteriales bacterium]
MFDKEKWGEIFQSIGKNKLRTVLTGFAVFWGIFMLVLLLGLGAGLRNGFAHNFRNTAENSISIWGNETSKVWNGLPANREIRLNEEDVEALRNSIPGLQNISGSYRVWRGNSQLQYGNNFGSYNINGVVSEQQQLQKQVIERGRFINEVDEAQVRKVITIAEDARKELFKDEDPMDKWVNVNGIPFQVVGLYRFENEGEGGMMQRSPVFIPLSAAQRVFNAQRDVDQIMFSFSDATLPGSEMAEQRARHTLARLHNFDPTDERALWLENNVENVSTFNGVFGGISAFIWFIGIGSLVAGIVGIGNIMLIVVKDRTREIGIRKALGATPANVIGQILLEAVFVTALFGYLGLALGVFLLEGLASVIPGSAMFRNPTIDLGVALWALFAMLVAGALAGYFPARRAAAIRPIEALRDE